MWNVDLAGSYYRKIYRKEDILRTALLIAKLGLYIRTMPLYFCRALICESAGEGRREKKAVKQTVSILSYATKPQYVATTTYEYLHYLYNIKIICYFTYCTAITVNIKPLDYR